MGLTTLLVSGIMLGAGAAVLAGCSTLSNISNSKKVEGVAIAFGLLSGGIMLGGGLLFVLALDQLRNGLGAFFDLFEVIILTGAVGIRALMSLSKAPLGAKPPGKRGMLVIFVTALAIALVLGLVLPENFIFGLSFVIPISVFVLEQGIEEGKISRRAFATPGTLHRVIIAELFAFCLLVVLKFVPRVEQANLYRAVSVSGILGIGLALAIFGIGLILERSPLYDSWSKPEKGEELMDMHETEQTLEKISKRLDRIEFLLDPEGKTTVAGAFHERVRRDLADIDRNRGGELDRIETLERNRGEQLDRIEALERNRDEQLDRIETLERNRDEQLNRIEVLLSKMQHPKNTD